MNNYKVYIHIFPNKKVYIGITSQKEKRRWNNGNGYKNNEYMTNAIQKYGWENIEHKILFTDLTKEEAEQKEIELIDFYKSNQKEYGYNIQNGGNASNGLTNTSKEKISLSQKKIWENEEYKKHMIEIHKGKKASEETKRKMSISNSKYWLGKHLSKKTIDKMKSKLKGKKAWNKGLKGVMKPNKTSFKIGEVHSITKKVMCVETEVIYNSISDASKKLNINPTCIVNVCKGKQKTAGGLHWKYSEK